MAQTTYCPHCLTENPIGNMTCRACGMGMVHRNSSTELPVLSILHGRYLIGRSIGSGGFGITYVGLDLLLGVKVAIKEYFPIGCANRMADGRVYNTEKEQGGPFDSGKKEFLHEAHVLSYLLEEPCFVHTQEFFEENGTEYIVLEFVEGQTLRNYLSGKKISFNEAFQMLRPAMTALDKLHANHHIAHLDLSPSNIMRLPDGRLRVIDFGAATEFGPMNEESIHVLKPGYAPEEQYRTNGMVSAASDVYAMCATIYSLITGTVPVAAPDRIFEDSLPLPISVGADITPAQQDVLMRGLAVKPEKRIASMGKLISQFDDAGRKKLYISPKKKLFAGIGIGVAAAVLALCLIFTGSGGSSGSGLFNNVITVEGPRVSPKPSLSPDAYPVEMYSCMKELAGFKKQELYNSEGLKVYAEGCYYGDGHMYLVISYSNNNKFEISTGSISFGTQGVCFSEFYPSFKFQPNTEKEEYLPIDCNYIAIAGFRRINSLYMKLDPYYYDSTSTVKWNGDERATEVRLPKGIDLPRGFNKEGTLLYSGITSDGNKFEFYSNGIQALADDNKAFVYISGRIVDPEATYYYDSVITEVNPDSIMIDGKKFYSTSTVTKYLNLDDDWEVTHDCFEIQYAYAVSTDEMNVRHSDSTLPETIEFELSLYDSTYDSDTQTSTRHDFCKLKLCYELNENGVGDLASFEKLK